MIALIRAGASVRLTGKNARSIYVTVHDTSFWLRLDDEAGIAKEPNEYEPPRTAAGSALVLAIPTGGRNPPQTRWSDDQTGKLVSKLRYAVAGMLVHAEASFRSSREHQHRWRIERRADRLEELYLARLKAEQAECDRLEKEKQERVHRLLGKAEAFPKAEAIRAYVASAQERASGLCTRDVAAWATWALGVASSIDPLMDGASLLGIPEEG